MSRWQSFRFRLIAAYTGLIVAGFMILAVITGRQVSSGTLEDFENQVANQAILVARGLKESFEETDDGRFNSVPLSNLVADFASQFNLRITLLDPDGRAWLDSTNQLPAGQFSGLPEVAAAMSQKVINVVRDNEAGVASVYTAAPIIEDGRIVSIVQLSAPLAEARQVVFERWLALGGGILLLALLALAAGLWLSNSFTRPLERLRGTALQLAGGDFSRRLPENRDDELGQLASAFNHMADEIQSMIEEQRAFASNAAHELRTPLTTIRLRSEALRTGQLDEATAVKYVVEIDDEVTRLGSLIQDLILLSRLEAGRFEPGDEVVDLQRLFFSLHRQLQPQAQAGQIELVLETTTRLPEIVASANHMQTVFYNLLTNALKYTPAGGRITWHVRAKNGSLHATITDTGSGITAEDLPHLFERFYRADKARSRHISGTGLGLSLVQTIIQAYGGQVSITSPGLGLGTTVELTWPANRGKRSLPD